MCVCARMCACASTGNKVADFFVKQKSMFFYKLIFSSLYNFFYSSLATIIICSRVRNWLGV